jgi:hypothetical protein
MAGRGDEALLRADDPAIHAFVMGSKQDLDARDKRGHDELKTSARDLDCFTWFAMTDEWQLICPTGKSAKSCPALARKIFLFFRRPNQSYVSRCPAPLKRGASRSSRTLGAGCGGRGST